MRGLAPEDARLFGDDALPVLRVAAAEIVWLLDRGYRLAAAVAFVGDHHQLESRARKALERAVCSSAQVHARKARELSLDELVDRTLVVDGFNVLVTLETAFAGGMLFEGVDGVTRDLAGMRGSYHLAFETDRALEALSALFARHRVARVEWLLDAPVSSSGRLRARIEATSWPCETTARLSSDVDRELDGRECIASADGVVLDRCASWVNLARSVVDTLPGARIVRFGDELTSPLRRP